MTRRRRGKRKEPEKKTREILINVGPAEKRVVILENDALVDFFMERKGLENYAGSIYKGRVSAIRPVLTARTVVALREEIRYTIYQWVARGLFELVTNFWLKSQGNSRRRIRNQVNPDNLYR